MFCVSLLAAVPREAGGLDGTALLKTETKGTPKAHASTLKRAIFLKNLRKAVHLKLIQHCK